MSLLGTHTQYTQSQSHQNHYNFFQELDDLNVQVWPTKFVREAWENVADGGQ